MWFSKALHIFKHEGVWSRWKRYKNNAGTKCFPNKEPVFKRNVQNGIVFIELKYVTSSHRFQCSCLNIDWCPSTEQSIYNKSSLIHTFQSLVNS